jgi:hypothetical protein
MKLRQQKHDRLTSVCIVFGWAIVVPCRDPCDHVTSSAEAGNGGSLDVFLFGPIGHDATASGLLLPCLCDMQPDRQTRNASIPRCIVSLLYGFKGKKKKKKVTGSVVAVAVAVACSSCKRLVRVGGRRCKNGHFFDGGT